MIVVEGPDGAGKTTLIEKIVEATGLSVAPRVVSKEAKAMVDLKDWTEKNVAKGFQATVFDRHRLISEPIYGPILRPKLEPGFDSPSWMHRMLTQFYRSAPFVVYCLPPLYRVWENVQDDENNKVVAQQHIITQVWCGYLNKALTELTVSPHRPIYMYDYTIDPDGHGVDMILVNLESRLRSEGIRP